MSPATPKLRNIGNIGETEVSEFYPDPEAQAGIVFCEIDEAITDDTKIVPFSESLLYVEWLDIDHIVATAEQMQGAKP